MDRTKSQFSRLLEVDRRIRKGEYPNCLSFSVDWEVAQKTVQRDIDYLRDVLGAPIEYDRKRHGYHYANSSWFLPSISVSEGDFLAILIAERAMEQYRGTPIAGELERVFGKLSAMLPDKVTMRPELIYNKFSFTAPPSRTINNDVWAVVVRGLVYQQQLRVSYRSPEKGVTTQWTLAPLHLANLQGEWYLFAKPDDGGEVRQFSLGRIQKATLTEKHFDMPAGFDAKGLLSNTFGRYVIHEHNHSIRLLFDKEVAPWVLEKQWGPKQTIRTRRNGDVEVTFSAAGLFEVFRWVMGWGQWARVLGPAELANMVGDEVRAMAGRLEKHR